MKVFVTGGTGLLGWNVVDALRARGDAITALVRRADASEILGPGVALVQGDLREVAAFEARLAGADVLIHAGACYGEYYRSGAIAALRDTNVRGTVALLDAAVRRGVRNVVFVSSAAVLAPRDGAAVDEGSPYAEATDDPYFASKVEAEKAVLAFLDGHPALRSVLVLPSVMLGPGDRGPTPTGSFVLKLLRGEVPFVLPGWHRIADARDVAHAVVEAIDRGERGERFVVGGPRVEVAEICRTLAEVTGRPGPARPISPGKLLMVAHAMRLAAAVTGRRPLVTPAMVHRLQAAFTYDSSRAERRLGLRCRPLAETLADTAAWFRAQGMG
jgi:dihydroflavonol-4-reductase